MKLATLFGAWLISVPVWFFIVAWAPSSIKVLIWICLLSGCVVFGFWFLLGVQ